MNLSVVASGLSLPGLLLCVLPVQAQPVVAPPLADSHHRLLVGVALEPEVVVSLGYTYDLGHGTGTPASAWVVG